MSLPDGVRKLETPMLVLFVFSKFLIGLGLGVLLATYLLDWGWWLLLAGILLSIPPAIKIIAGR